MIRNSLYLFAILLLVSFISACDWFGGDCGSSNYTYNYVGIEIEAFNTSGFQSKVTTDSAYKNAFGLEVYCHYDELETAYSFSFSLFPSAYALSCVDPVYNYTDPINNLKIYFLEPNNDDKIDVTTSFQIFSFYSENELISIEEHLKLRETWDNNFQLELVNTENIPDQCKFIAELHLESGNVFTEETTVITFDALN